VTLTPCDLPWQIFGSPNSLPEQGATHIVDRRLFRCLCCHIDRDVLSSLFAFMERHTAGNQCEKRVIFAKPDIAARPNARPALAHKNIARKCGFATELFHAKAATGRITTVAR
jgi:hypothetical protein